MRPHSTSLCLLGTNWQTHTHYVVLFTAGPLFTPKLLHRLLDHSIARRCVCSLPPSGVQQQPKIEWAAAAAACGCASACQRCGWLPLFPREEQDNAGFPRQKEELELNMKSRFSLSLSLFYCQHFLRSSFSLSKWERIERFAWESMKKLLEKEES